MSRRKPSSLLHKVFQSPYYIKRDENGTEYRRGFVLDEPASDLFLVVLVTDDGRRGPTVTVQGSKMGGWTWFDEALREWNVAFALQTVLAQKGAL